MIKMIAINNKIIVATALAFICLNPSQAKANILQNNQPLEVRADRADINQSKHIGVYSGAVEFDQGDTHIRADHAVTKTDKNNKLTEATIYGNSKNQAHYWSQPSADKPILHAYADTITYLPNSDNIELIGNAKVQQGNNSFSAPHIIYNIKKQHVVSSKSTNDKRRTKIIFYPQRKLNDPIASTTP